jgi:hypothetical protein
MNKSPKDIKVASTFSRIFKTQVEYLVLFVTQLHKVGCAKSWR